MGLRIPNTEIPRRSGMAAAVEDATFIPTGHRLTVAAVGGTHPITAGFRMMAEDIPIAPAVDSPVEVTVAEVILVAVTAEAEAEDVTVVAEAVDAEAVIDA